MSKHPTPVVSPKSLGGQLITINDLSIDVYLTCQICGEAFESYQLGPGPLSYHSKQANSEGWRMQNGEPICKGCID